MIVFLDSNIYIGAKYRVESGRFRSLRILLEHGDIHLLYTSINAGEVKEHIRKDIDEGVQAYNKVLKDRSVLLSAESAYHLSKIASEVGVAGLDEMIDGFFKLSGVQCIPIDPINAEELMRDYFEQRPPFESKKPEEFKDAIIIHALREYKKTVDDQVVVISNDKGFNKAFEGDAGFITYEKIDDFLATRQRQLHEYGIYDCIESFIDDGEANEAIKSYLQDWDINRGYYSGWECDHHEITDIESEFLYADLTENGAIVHLEVQVWLQAEINHRDEDDSFFDREDNEYLFETWVNAQENHSTKVDIDLEISIHKNENGEYIIDDCSIIEDGKYHWLDIDEDTMTHYRVLSSNYMGEERDNLETCSNCGKILGRSLNGAFFDYNGNPLCSDCMKADGKYDICPRCGRRVPIEHMMSGFCDRCTSLKEYL